MFFQFLSTLKKTNTHRWFLRRKFNALSNVFNLRDYLNNFFFIIIIIIIINKLSKYIKVTLIQVFYKFFKCISTDINCFVIFVVDFILLTLLQISYHIIVIFVLGITCENENEGFDSIEILTIFMCKYMYILHVI